MTPEAWKPASLGLFSGKLHHLRQLALPADQPIDPNRPVAMESGPGEVVRLSYAPRGRAVREPIHEELMLELPPLPAVGSSLEPQRVVYRAGAERVVYLATQASGTIKLVEDKPERVVLDIDLTLSTPALDAEHIGPRVLEGQVIVDRVAPS